MLLAMSLKNGLLYSTQIGGPQKQVGRLLAAGKKKSTLGVASWSRRPVALSEDLIVDAHEIIFSDWLISIDLFMIQIFNVHLKEIFDRKSQ